MELFQLRYFAAAARSGNFSKAAKEVCISQPSLSQQIANLEREIGTPLFIRQGRSVLLTDAGHTLLEHAERILAQEREAFRAVRAVVGLERGRLSLWTLPTPGQSLLPNALVPFRKAHPGVEITVHEAVPARAVAEAVATGKADLGFVHVPYGISGLSEHTLLTEELALVVPDSHPLALGDTSPLLSELATEDFVWVPQGNTQEHPIFAACLTAGFTPHIVCVSGSAQGMQSLVAAGLGIALLPRLALHPPEGTVVVELARPRPTRTLAVIWRGDAFLSHTAKAFLEILRKESLGH